MEEIKKKKKKQKPYSKKYLLTQTVHFIQLKKN